MTQWNSLTHYVSLISIYCRSKNLYSVNQIKIMIFYRQIDFINDIQLPTRCAKLDYKSNENSNKYNF